MKDHNNDSRIRFGDNASVNGPVAGRDLTQHIHPAPIEPKQEYSRRQVRFLPVTERGLNITAALISLLMFFSGFQTARELWHQRPRLGADAMNHANTVMGWEFWAFIGLVVLWIPTITLAWVVRRRTQTFSRFSFLPGLAGAKDDSGRGRLVLIRNGGECQKCRGKLRFYAAPWRWEFRTNRETGKVRKVVTARRPAAVCDRDPEHISWLESTDTDDLQSQ